MEIGLHSILKKQFIWVEEIEKCNCNLSLLIKRKKYDRHPSEIKKITQMKRYTCKAKC